MSVVALIDFESRSACNLKLSGSWRYSLDPTTEVLCLAFRLPHWDAGRVSLWHPAIAGLPESGLDDSLSELLDWIQDGGLIEAHNASFERGIWTNIMVARYGWPSIDIRQWRCSAAKAASHALPRGLDDASAALKLKIRKDADGGKVMMKMSKPRKPRKAEREAGVTGLLWWETPELFERLFAYCRQDILTEEAVSHALPDLSAAEQAIYTLDQIINERGFQLDTEAVSTALSLIETETAVLNSELTVLTGGQVKKATQRAQMLNWLSEEGLQIADTQKETIDYELASGTLTPNTARALELMRALGRSSTAKYVAMQNHMDQSGRVMGGLLYHGASTGRWSGSGVQPHNFPKGTVKDQDALWEVLKTRDREFIAAQYKGVMEALSNGLRGAIVAKPGHQLYCVAPETRVLRSDLQWVRSDSLQPGERLLGFDEHSGQGKGKQRKFKPSYVKTVSKISRPRIRVVTTQGTITVSAEHQFLVRQHKRKGGWAEANTLRVGDQIAFLQQPWEFDTSREGGYLAGILDGEGHVSGHNVGWAQNKGPVFDRVCAALTLGGFSYRFNGDRLRKVEITGGLGETLRLLGTIRPTRLLANSQRVWDTRRIWGQRTPIATVLELLLLTDGDVIAVETSTGTLITEGFLSHNCADYSGIEARVVQWLADDQDALDFFRTGGDPYKDMASSIYNVPIPEVSKDQRQLGKAAILGAGFGMGWAKFVSNCADVWGLTIADELAQQTIAAYREKFWRLVDMWKDQENAALRAVSSRQPVECGYVTWWRTKDFLYCQLPSGRNLAYPFPQIRMRMTPWGEEKLALTFMGINSYTRKWERQGTYGGSIVENQTQAVARDLMADAMQRCGLLGYPVVLTVHDEIISEVPLLAGSVHEFEEILTTVPGWAEGCPIGAEGWVGTRYRK